MPYPWAEVVLEGGNVAFDGSLPDPTVPTLTTLTAGHRREQRGTVQSDRWRGRASMLAGDKLIAVMPRLGWWNERTAFRDKALPFSLVVTVIADGLDIYTPISVALEAGIEVTV